MYTSYTDCPLYTSDRPGSFVISYFSPRFQMYRGKIPKICFNNFRQVPYIVVTTDYFGILRTSSEKSSNLSNIGEDKRHTAEEIAVEIPFLAIFFLCTQVASLCFFICPNSKTKIGNRRDLFLWDRFQTRFVL